MKRFQECNKITQVWRYRWYLLIPFKWMWFSTVQLFKVRIVENVNDKIQDTAEFDVIHGKDLWKLLKGIAQGKMKWTYTLEEVKASLKRKNIG